MIQFTCYCHPEPQGSAKGFPIRRKNGTIGVSITSDNPKLKPFRQAVTLEAINALKKADEESWWDEKPFAAKHVPVHMEITCYFQKPGSVAKKRTLPAVKPDVDKLARAIFDACTGILFADDAQVVELAIRKRYGTPERVEVKAEIIVGSTEDNPTPVLELPLFEIPF